MSRRELDFFSSMPYRKNLVHLYVIYMPQHHAALEFFQRIQKNAIFFVYVGKRMYRHTVHRTRSFLNANFRPRIHPLVGFVPLAPNYHTFSNFNHLSEPVFVSACFQLTGSTPAGIQEAFRAVYSTRAPKYIK